VNITGGQQIIYNCYDRTIIYFKYHREANFETILGNFAKIITDETFYNLIRSIIKQTTTTTMFFKLGRIFITSSLILLIGFSAFLDTKALKKNNTALISERAFSIDSLKEKAIGITTPKHQKDNNIVSKINKESRSSLNSVNLIIYMIYKVTNKSL
jgi:hypothetical protein